MRLLRPRAPGRPALVAALAAGVLILTGCGSDTTSLSSAPSGGDRPTDRVAAPAGGTASPTISVATDDAGDASSSAASTTHSGPTPSTSVTAPTPARTAVRTTRPGSTPAAKVAAAPVSRPVAAGRTGAPPIRVTARAAAPARDALAGAIATPAPGVLEYPPGAETGPEADVVRLINAERVSAGCRPLTVNGTLVMVARAHSLEMSTVQDGVKHNSRNGMTPFQRMRTAGYSYAVAAENVAGGQPTADAVVDAWMDSPGHRSNILNCALTQIGIGMFYRAGSQYGTYWTQDFATPM